MKRIKSFLLRTLGQQAYLQLTSRLFFRYFEKGWLRGNPNYYTHYFVKNFIHPDDVVLDIGANLGYYSLQFAKLTGKTGRVYCVEPIEIYRKILKKNLNGLSQVEILPFALGETEGEIKMGNPTTDKHRHGLMRVLSEQEKDSETNVYDVMMKNPARLFEQLEKIDYIKCDIEGYEVPVIPIMEPLIRRHQPIVQIETDGENKLVIFRLLAALNYRMFFVSGNRLKAYNDPSDTLPGDLIGIPQTKTFAYSHLFS